MKILFVTQTYPPTPDDTSGPFIRDLARGLTRRGDDVTVLTPHAVGVRSAWDDDGVAVRSFRYAPERLEVLGYGRSLSADEAARPGAAAVAPLYLAGALATSWHRLRDGFDIVHAHWLVPNGLLAPPLSRKSKVAIGLHGSDVFMAERRELRPVVRRALARTSVLTSCSPEFVDRICSIGFPRERAHVIPYGVDSAKFAPDITRRMEWRHRLGIPSGATVILSVGRMVSKKGYDSLLAALPHFLDEHPGTHVVLGGGGDLLDAFRKQAATWSDRVHLPGAVRRDVLPDLYRAADVFVLPAIHDRQGNVDGLPNVILEAMSSGLPVIASGISGIPLVVDDTRTGRLVPEQAPLDLARAISELIRTPEVARRMGAAARRRVERELTWDAVAARYYDAYRGAIREPEVTA